MHSQRAAGHAARKAERDRRRQEGLHAESEVVVAERTWWPGAAQELSVEEWSKGSSQRVCCPGPGQRQAEQAIRVSRAPSSTEEKRCCRCGQATTSYFDHTCPQCAAIMCTGCLDDFRLILHSFRCPACGDERASQASLQQEIMLLNAYRGTSRVFSGIGESIAGLFGYAPGSQSAPRRPSQANLVASEPWRRTPQGLVDETTGDWQEQQGQRHNYTL